MALAVNQLIALQGGFVVASKGSVLAELALPVAGLMSDRPATEVEDSLRILRRILREMGCGLDEPFVQMAFLPLSASTPRAGCDLIESLSRVASRSRSLFWRACSSGS